ncbi:MAG: ribulokinase, partial [Eubacterium aggregans]
AGSDYGSALGAAVFGALAAGTDRGGYDSVFDATKVMANLTDIEYIPNEDNAKVYDQLYAEFLELHNLFGRGQNDMMKRLKKIREAAIDR